jgi:uroporphyrinogen decarboxylase
MPNSRERVKAAINHQIPDRIPRGELCIGDDLIKDYLNCTEVGFEERAAFVEKLGQDLVCLPPDYPVGKDVPDVADVLLPDVERWALEQPFFTFAMLDGICGWGVRTLGYTEFLTLPRSSPLSFQELCRSVAELNRELIKRLIDQGVDGILLADDIAYQRGVLFNPELMRECLFPSLGSQVEAAGGNVPVFFHSDGNYAEVIPDLIQCGFQGLECFERSAGMDVGKLQELYRGQLCLWGTLEVEDLIKAHDSAFLDELVSGIQQLAAQGGFILGTTCGLFKGIDLDGLVAIYERL